jgi:hypothetical protein
MDKVETSTILCIIRTIESFLRDNVIFGKMSEIDWQKIRVFLYYNGCM